MKKKGGEDHFMELKNIFSKISMGLIQGVGFGLVFYYLSNYDSNSRLTELIKSTHDNKRLEKIDIQNLNEVTRDGKMFVLGSIKNNNPSGQRVITVQVDFFDKNKVFIEQCKEGIKGTLESQEVRNLKITCDSIVEHDSYKVYLLDH